MDAGSSANGSIASLPSKGIKKKYSNLAGTGFKNSASLQEAQQADNQPDY